MAHIFFYARIVVRNDPMKLPMQQYENSERNPYASDVYTKEIDAMRLELQSPPMLKKKYENQKLDINILPNTFAISR